MNEGNQEYFLWEVVSQILDSSSVPTQNTYLNMTSGFSTGLRIQKILKHSYRLWPSSWSPLAIETMESIMIADHTLKCWNRHISRFKVESLAPKVSPEAGKITYLIMNISHSIFHEIHNRIFCLRDQKHSWVLQRQHLLTVDLIIVTSVSVKKYCQYISLGSWYHWCHQSSPYWQ